VPNFIHLRVVPAFNESRRSALIAALRAGAVWHEIIVVDDGSRDATAERPARPARPWCASYNKGNVAGSRPASGRRQRIRAHHRRHGQHRAADAARLVSKLVSTTSSSARARRGTQASRARHAGNAALNWLAGYLTARKVPDLTSDSGGAAASPCESSCTSCQRLLHADDATLAFIKAGYNVASRQSRPTRERRQSKIRAGAGRRQVPADRASRSSRCSPASRVPADQPGRLPHRGGYAAGPSAHSPRHEFFGAADHAVPVDSWWAGVEQIAGAQVRRPE